MEQLIQNTSVINKCEKLLETINCDFVGLAFQNRSGPDIKWHFAAGNSNDKFKRIILRYGKGIAGRVILTGRPMAIHHFPNHIQGKAIEYPIMLAEKLISAYAVPIHYKQIPKGVLLVGRRTIFPFTEREQQLTQRAAEQLENMLNNRMNLD